MSAIWSCKIILWNYCRIIGKIGQKNDINSVRGLSDKQTMLDSSVYFRGDVKGLVYPLLACSEPHTHTNSGLIFHFGL